MKNKEAIIEQLEVTYHKLIHWLGDQAEAQFSVSPAVNKWTAGQHADHLVKSTQPLNSVFKMPRFTIRTMFGKPNREGRTYEEIVAKYQQKLKEGAVANGRFLPKQVTTADKYKIMAALTTEKEKLQNVLRNWREEDLDKYLIPHPILGKLTVREMFYFTIYHTEHHINILKNQYE